MTRDETNKFVQAIVDLRESATDQQASIAPAIYPTMKYDKQPQETPLITVGTRINWNGVVMRAAVDLWDREENNPDNAPDLWEKLNYRDGIRIIPDVITVTSAFSKGEKGWWGDVVYTSKVDNNVYTPEQYPDNWTTNINEVI